MNSNNTFTTNNVLARNKLTALALAFVFASSFLSSAQQAYGHGLGIDEAPYIDVSGRRIAVEGKMSPAFIDDLGDKKPTLMVRTFDKSSNQTVADIDYRIIVDYGNETLLDNKFMSSDGIFLANLVPDKNVSSPAINNKEQGTESIAVSQASPVEIRSKIFSDGGLYHIIVTVEETSQGLQLQEDQKFDLFISVGKSYPFELETESGEKKKVVLKSYYDEITDFSYDLGNKTVSFVMPFLWDLDYVNQISVLHVEYDFPKSMEEFQSNGYTSTVNGFDLPPSAVLIDDYSSEENRIVHLVVNTPKLDELSRKIKEDRNIAIFTLNPIEKPKFPVDIMTTTEKYLFQLTWDPAIIETGTPISFVMNIQDPAIGDLVRNSSFEFTIVQNGREIHKQFLRSDLGTYSYQYTFAHEQAGWVTLEARNINNKGEVAKMDLLIVRGSGTSPPGPGPNQNQGQQPSGCLIATAAFGSELAPQVQYLRNFRDSYILSSISGSAFMNAFNAVYYSFSPSVADYERQNPWLQQTVKAGLYPLFGILYLSERAYASVYGGEAGVILAGATASALIGAVYVSPVVALTKIKRMKFNKPILLVVPITLIGMLAGIVVQNQIFLSVSTAAFVIAVTALSAVAAPKVISGFFQNIRKGRK